MHLFPKQSSSGMRGNSADFLLSMVKTLPNILKIDVGGQLLKIKSSLWGPCTIFSKPLLAIWFLTCLFCVCHGQVIFPSVMRMKDADVCKVPRRACYCCFIKWTENLLDSSSLGAQIYLEFIRYVMNMDVKFL